MPGIFFSLANLAWRSTSEILWVLGELEPEGAEAILEGREAEAEPGALALVVVVFRRTAAPADEGLGVDDIVVLAWVILGLDVVLEVEEEGTNDLTLLAYDDVGLTLDLIGSEELSLLEDEDVVVVDFNAVDTVTLLVILSRVDSTLEFKVLEVAFLLFIVPTIVDMLPVLLDFLTGLKLLFEELLDVGSGSVLAESVL